MGSSVPKIAPTNGVSGRPSNTWFPVSTWVLNSNDISVGSAIFAQTTTECAYTVQWDAPSHLKIAPSYGDLDPI